MSAIVRIDQKEITEYSAMMRSMLGLPVDVPDEVVKATAQLALRYNLDPFTKEIQIIPGKKSKVTTKDANGKDVDMWVQTYMPYVGVNGLARSARRVCTYDYEPRTLSAEETKELRGADYDPADVGVEVTLYRHDIEAKVKAMGRQYHPTVAVGLWRKNARQIDKWENGRKVGIAWEPDGIPNTMTRKSKAEQRALRAAIKIAYDLSLPEWVANDDVMPDGESIQAQANPDGVYVIVEDNTAKLLEAGWKANQVSRMDDEQQATAVQREEFVEGLKWLSDEELQARAAQNAAEMRPVKHRMGDEGFASAPASLPSGNGAAVTEGEYRPAPVTPEADADPLIALWTAQAKNYAHAPLMVNGQWGALQAVMTGICGGREQRLAFYGDLFGRAVTTGEDLTAAERAWLHAFVKPYADKGGGGWHANVKAEGEIIAFLMRHAQPVIPFFDSRPHMNEALAAMTPATVAPDEVLTQAAADNPESKHAQAA